jgi:LysM repeat protein
MRTLIGLTTLMLVLAAAVWWKTRAADDPGQLPATTTSNPREGVATVGLREGDRTEGSTPTPAAGAGGGRATEAGFGGGETGGATESGNTTEMGDWISSGGDEPSKRGSDPVPPPVVDPPVEEPPAPPVLKHTVAEGETLYRIVVNAYGTAPAALVEAVAAANGLDDPGRLGVGDVLELPELPGYPAPARP